MNAQAYWKLCYRALDHHLSDVTVSRYRKEMLQYRYAAALERKLEAMQRTIQAQAVAAEREACAKVADSYETEAAYQLSHRAVLPQEKQQRMAQMDLAAQVAAAIRARNGAQAGAGGSKG